MQDPSLPPGCRQSDVDGPPDERRRPGDPLGQLSEFFAEHYRAAGSLVPGKADLFVKAFLDEYGEEFVDELFGTTSLWSVGEVYQRKLLKFAMKKGIIDDDAIPKPRTPAPKPPKLASPSAAAQEPADADQRAAS